MDKMTAPQILDAMKGAPDWAETGGQIHRTYQFKDFVEAMKFVNKVADVAEAQGHHPDIHIHWNKVELVLWTHAIGGLHENDFVMAAKLERLA